MIFFICFSFFSQALKSNFESQGNLLDKQTYLSTLKENQNNAIKDAPVLKDLSRKNMFEITKPLLRLENEWVTQQPILIKQLKHFFIKKILNENIF